MPSPAHILSLFLLAAATGEAPERPKRVDEVRAAAEEVVVEARRLEAPAEEAPPAPPHVLRLGREEIAASGAETLQGLLEERAEILTFDQVGNGLESELDLRGFAGGTHLAVVVDGARLNAPDDNRADLELLFTDEIDELELRRGAGSTIHGAGAGAGVLRLRSRSVPEEAGGEAWSSAGSDGAFVAGARGYGTAGDLRVSAAVERDLSDGFRANGGWSVTRGRLRAEGRLGTGLLRGTVHLASLSAGNPGALKAIEWREDPEQAPFNGTDRHRARLGLGVLRWDGSLGAWDLGLMAAARDASDEVLTTGRFAAGRRGFLTETSTGSLEAVAQAARRGDGWELVLGIEASRARVAARGWETDPAGEDRLEVSDTETTSDRTALLVQGARRLGSRWELEGGLRIDELRLRTGGTGLDPASRDPSPRGGARDWTVGSPRLAVTRATSRGPWRGAWRLGLSRGFLLPTPLELFAFPGFGSNPDLDPTRILDLEVGWSGKGPGGARLSVNAFWMEVRDEVFFDLAAPDAPFGRNEGRDTRRLGLELSGSAALGGGWSLGASGVWIEATYREAWTTGGGEAVEPGAPVPLVPATKLALTVGGPLGLGWQARLHGRWIDGRLLDGDPNGRSPELGSTHLWDLILRRPALLGGGLEVRLEVHNLLDRRYATRGIAHIPDERGIPHDFFTPAPGRKVEAGLHWSF